MYFILLINERERLNLYALIKCDYPTKAIFMMTCHFSYHCVVGCVLFQPQKAPKYIIRPISDQTSRRS